MRSNLFSLTIAALFALNGCSMPVMITQSDFDLNKIRRVSVMKFDDFEGMPGSGEKVSAAFEKALLQMNYKIVERRQVDKILEENKFSYSGSVDPDSIRQIGQILGVDALILGTITVYTPAKKNVVLVDIREQNREPVYQTEVSRVKQGDKWVNSERSVVTGYKTNRKVYQMPQTYTLEAEVGTSVRMVDVESGEVLWVGSASEEAVNSQAAAEMASNRIVRALKKMWPKQEKLASRKTP